MDDPIRRLRTDAWQLARLIVPLLVALWLAGCSTRNVVVAPDQVPKLDDSKWTITSEPATRPR